MLMASALLIYRLRFIPVFVFGVSVGGLLSSFAKPPDKYVSETVALDSSGRRVSSPPTRSTQSAVGLLVGLKASGAAAPLAGIQAAQTQDMLCRSQ
ncbi:hypothetical protein EYF80_029007 [Liparis tanakae]|uniref:Uncharacterized protein n=1 Tax=Liparis tanakae TaxID=230148 RepID=A0A4Z2H6W2_9TELE|nr:hypothetical protein EYF80_029007 [Liparis tanakae]